MDGIHKEKSENRIMKRVIACINDHRGSTMVEMIVCFALLAIFMASAATLIGAIASLYFNISGEIYSREVSDIVMEKIVSELDGAEYVNPGEVSDITIKNPTIDLTDHKWIELFDKTGTSVRLYSENNVLKVHYNGYTVKINGDPYEPDSRAASDWYFNEEMYKGFNVEEIKFYACGEGSIDEPDYGLSGMNLSAYDKNVVLVLLKLHSNRYDDYYYYKFVRMYNLPEDFTWTEPSADEDDNT